VVANKENVPAFEEVRGDILQNDVLVVVERKRYGFAYLLSLLSIRKNFYFATKFDCFL
jgi:hypothetical protein